MRNTTVAEQSCKRSVQINLARSKANKDKREIELAFSSEHPVERYFSGSGQGFEVLSHDNGAVDLSRLNNGGALLVDHNPGDQIGVVVKAWIGADKVGRAIVRFSKSARGQEIFQDVLDGIRTLVSVSYDYLEQPVRTAKADKSGTPVYRIARWLPLEISIVSIPADPKVGIGRAERKSYMPKQNQIEIEESEESQDQAEILAIAERFHGKFPEEITKRALAERWPREVFRAAVIKNFRVQEVALPDANIGMGANEIAKYSIARAIHKRAMGEKFDGLEREASDAVGKKLGEEARGFWVPLDVLSHERSHYVRPEVRASGRRDLTVGTSADGGFLVGTDHSPQSFIELLRNESRCIQLGAMTLNGLVGNVAIPKQTSAITPYWVAETATITESQPAFGQLNLSPKRIGGSLDYSRSLLVQGTPDIENLIRMDLAAVIGIEQDRVAINGSGAAGQPTGILNTAGLTVVALGANGAAPTYESMVDLEGALGAANAAAGNLAYLVNSDTRKKLKKTLKVTGQPVYVWENGKESGEGLTNGYHISVSNNMPGNLVKGTSGAVCSALVFANWRDLIIATWGGLDVINDPYTQAREGLIRVTAQTLTDIGVRRVASFAAIKDALTT